MMRVARVRRAIIFVLSAAGWAVACTPTPAPEAALPDIGFPAAAAPAPKPTPKEVSGTDLVQVSLKWVHTGLSAEPTLVAELTPEPGWHVYWHNPGDAGLPTTFALTEASKPLPVGVRMVAPKRSVAPGAIVSYGFEGWTPFFMVPRDAWPKTKLGLRIEWLVCAEACKRGHATRTVMPPTGPAEPPSARLQTALNNLPKAREDRWAYDKGVWSLALPEGVTGRLYPHRALQERLDDQTPPFCKAGQCRLRLGQDAGQAEFAYTLQLSRNGTLTHWASTLRGPS